MCTPNLIYTLKSFHETVIVSVMNHKMQPSPAARYSRATPDGEGELTLSRVKGRLTLC